ncbi:MAM and LDL-receptor class A domain-containing protein 1-like [Dreissena polymorpha]|uniref:MAM domain-containing protein n=1 Tax=Dreissena polymorpha TaxID=45954 RepID=A0A9D4FLA2_DREPO|nr:MAM and LDL-receptor class A domain-containing protein 1-like [Dreissena polymorpha]KAH3798555.1 hypothetical protein DPMN_152155 [Dreissena polymorpha]
MAPTCSLGDLRHTRKDKVADLVSDLIYPREELCMHIAINMYGATMGRIDILTKDYGSSTPNSTIASFNMVTSNNPVWTEKDVQIPDQGFYYVIIRAVVGSGFASGIAIDDIIFNTGKC